MRNVLLILAGALLIAGCKKELNVQEPWFPRIRNSIRHLFTY
jgi:PBP1b-binding outer membrane lipoprotein LpoB